MKKKILACLISQLFLVSGSVAAAEGDFVEIGGRSTDESSLNAAKLFEYRDLDANGIFHGQFTGRTDDYSVRLRGENVFADDQFLELVGEKYNFLDYRIFNNKIVHNLSFGPAGGLSPWVGVGGGNLALAVPTPGNNPALWGPFDHEMQRDNWGGHLEVSPDSPFYIRFAANELNTDGIRPQGFRSTAGFAATELPGLVDWTTRNWTVETGWEATDYVISANFTQSRYYNNLFNKQITWQDPPNGTGNSATQQPDNVYNQFFLNGVYRKLPWSGALMGKFTYAKLENEQNTDPLGSGIAASTPAFSGDVGYTDVSLAYSAMPMNDMDLRVYYYYHDRDNKSTPVVYAGGFLTEALSYTKHNAGLQVGYRLSRANKLTGTYDYHYVSRSPILFYADETTDNKLQLEWRNTSLENVTARLKYWYLWRDSNFLQDFALPATDPEYIRNFISSYDVANLNQNVVKLTLDWAAMGNMALGTELLYKYNDYDDTVIGRTSDERYGVNLFANYITGGGIKLTAFADYENIKYDSNHRNLTSSCGAVPNCFDPIFGGVSATFFNWSGKVETDAWGFGVGLDVPVNERFNFVANFLTQKNDGEVNFESGQTPLTNVPIGISNWDDYTKYAFNLKGVYAINKQFDVTGGWTYEDYKFRDVGFDGYQYAFGSDRLTGAYANPDYHVNVLYATLKYKFQ